MTLMRFNPRNCRLLVLAACLGAFAYAQPVFGYGGVYTQTKHGDPVSGVQRDTSLPKGNCNQCHAQHGSAEFSLFMDNTNQLCFTCHNSPSLTKIYQGQAAYNTSTHGTNSLVVWPTPPPARAASEAGKCVN